jgi:hypothetical protein
LPADVRRKMESAFGADFSAVRIHVGPEASSIGALAFTYGSNIFFAPGQYDLHTTRGEQLLGHELTHVLQQRAGCVKNPFGSGIAVVHDDALETEADRMGHCAAAHRVDIQAQMAPAAPGQHPPAAPRSWIGRHEGESSPSGSVVQCAFAGALATKTFDYFKNEAAMTFKEYNDLNKSAVKYGSLEAVKEALKSMRAPGMPLSKPTATVVQAPAQAAPAIPATWTSTFVGPWQLYRAVDLSPGKIKRIGRFSPRTNPERALPAAIKKLLTDPRGFAEGHVRANYDYVHSACAYETCAGYQNTREYVYGINVDGMYRYDPPAGVSNISRPPIIWANTANRTLGNATKVAFDPRKTTDEVDLIFDIELSMIPRYKRRGATTWVTIDWSTIQPEL